MEREKTVAARSFQRLKDYMNANIVGQADLVDKLLVALLADGHLLVEGAPGLAKTKAIKKLSEAIEGDDQRIQFTPDLLPSDITGSDIYRPETGDFKFQAGPIFHNLILADEINRAPAKVQSALLEAMAERQVTVGGKTYRLPALFMVMATQNPIEQEGTYPLPEAQLDRFLMYVKIDQPDAAAERRILQIVRNEALEEGAEIPVEVMPQQRVFEARREVLNVHLSPALEEYVIQLVMATRKPEKYGEKFKRLVAFGASPRGTIALDRCARAKAWLAGRDFVLPEDVHGIVHDVLRHRVILTFEAEAEGITPDSFLDLLLKRVPLP
ncbi:MAG: AAA family ATPase [Acetobacter sp.]|nr:AAA family ATPase [Acetobacter sp.]